MKVSWSVRLIHIPKDWKHRSTFLDSALWNTGFFTDDIASKDTYIHFWFNLYDFSWKGFISQLVFKTSSGRSQYFIFWFLVSVFHLLISASMVHLLIGWYMDGTLKPLWRCWHEPHLSTTTTQHHLFQLEPSSDGILRLSSLFRGSIKKQIFRFYNAKQSILNSHRSQTYTTDLAMVSR